MEEAGGCQTSHPDHLSLQSPLLASSFESPKTVVLLERPPREEARNEQAGPPAAWGAVDTRGLTGLVRELRVFSAACLVISVCPGTAKRITACQANE